jgi:hypothetical protein
MGQTLLRLEAHGHITRNVAAWTADRTGWLFQRWAKRPLAQARALERILTPGVQIGVEELRYQLPAVIRRLGSARWSEEMPGQDL